MVRRRISRYGGVVDILWSDRDDVRSTKCARLGRMRMTKQRSLIVTLPPFLGGVMRMARVVAELLASRGHTVSFAYYATLGMAPELVAPSWRILRGARPGVRQETFADTFDATVVGCWLPELEYTYYRPSRAWADLIHAHDRHIAVGGTALVANPLTALGLRHLIWCATTLGDDRRERRQTWSALRGAFERLVVNPVQERMERDILAGPGTLMTISRHMRSQFASLGKSEDQVRWLPIPVDLDRFATSDAVAAQPGTIGLAGRLDDPRKNLPLLLEAIRRVVCARPRVRLVLAGEYGAVNDQCVAMGLDSHVEFKGLLSEAALTDFYRDLDLFVIPSRSEGHAIVGMEAMASGVPVISTRCGGPEDYVQDGINGFLTAHDASEIADCIIRLMDDRELRNRLGANARHTAQQSYSPGAFADDFARTWRDVWNEDP